MPRKCSAASCRTNWPSTSCLERSKASTSVAVHTPFDAPDGVQEEDGEGAFVASGYGRGLFIQACSMLPYASCSLLNVILNREYGEFSNWGVDCFALQLQCCHTSG
eukprot:362745-Chlamydomonas_euryale.AAC.9